VATTGQISLDRALGGGWRRGEISELVGARSSGRTSLLVTTLSAATDRGDIVGLVDACDCFDPAGAAACGLDLSRVLWIRGPSVTAEFCGRPLIETVVRRAIRAFDLLLRAGGFGIAVLDVADVPARWLRSVPMTTWLRMAHANEGRDTVGLMLGEAPMGRSARGATVRVQATSRWTGSDIRQRCLSGLDVRVNVASATRLADHELQLTL
jgi:hypothetical protein